MFGCLWNLVKFMFLVVVAVTFFGLIFAFAAYALPFLVAGFLFLGIWRLTFGKKS